MSACAGTLNDMTATTPDGNACVPAVRERTLDEFFAGQVLAETVAATRQGVYPFGIMLGTLEAAGIALADLVTARRGDRLPEVEADRSMYLTLGNYWVRHRGISLRAAVGWYLAFRADPTVPVEDPVDVWVRADRRFVETGWLFLAAGIDLDEARAHLACGVDIEALLAMAALRGSHLPATC